MISSIDASAGGTATALAALAVAQKRVGIDVSVASTFAQPEEQAASRLHQCGIMVTQIGPAKSPLARHPEIVPALRRLIARHDIVHIHALWEEIQYQAGRIARELELPHVITPHGMLDPWSLSQSALKKRIYLALRLRKNLNTAAAIHFTTATERDLVAPLGLRAPTFVEPNGVDLSEFDQLPARGTFRARFPQLENHPVVIFLGRLHYKKGLDLLVPAFARGAPVGAMLVIAGPDYDGYQHVVEEMLDANSVSDRAIFTGMLRGRERIEALVDSDLFVLPSYQENFGIAVIEALAARCPVVISDQVNIHDQITANHVGGVVPTDIGPLTSELARWLNDPKLRADAAARGPAFVREHYDWNRIARDWLGHYERIVASHRKGVHA